MATARVTVGTIFETVSTAATVATGALNSVSGVVAMANAFVAKAQRDQSVQYLLDAEKSEERMIEEAAFEQAETDLKIAAYRNKSTQHQHGYDQAYARYAAILRKPKGESSVSAFRTAAE
jgi:hypothetical protein